MLPADAVTDDEPKEAGQRDAEERLDARHQMDNLVPWLEANRRAAGSGSLLRFSRTFGGFLLCVRTYSSLSDLSSILAPNSYSE